MAPAAKAYLVSGFPRSMRDVVEYQEKVKEEQEMRLNFKAYLEIHSAEGSTVNGVSFIVTTPTTPFQLTLRFTHYPLFTAAHVVVTVALVGRLYTKQLAWNAHFILTRNTLLKTKVNHFHFPSALSRFQIGVVSGVILVSWRQAVLQKQIDYGAKLGHVVLSLAKMELENFFKNVMPVADYFDQSDLLLAVSRNFPIYLNK